MAPQCPKCGSRQIHRSHRRTLKERAAWLVGVRTRRCHGCNFRFAQAGSRTIRPAEFALRIERLGWVGITALALAAVLGVVVLLSYKDATYFPFGTKPF
jgi:hypothetical protein